jgi:hypothetical protein
MFKICLMDFGNKETMTMSEHNIHQQTLSGCRPKTCNSKIHQQMASISFKFVVFCFSLMYHRNGKNHGTYLLIACFIYNFSKSNLGTIFNSESSTYFFGRLLTLIDVCCAYRQ